MPDSKLYQLIKNNLYVTQVIKNYKILCELLEQEVKQGKSKILQENNIHIKLNKEEN